MVDIVNEIYFCCKYVLYLLVFMYFTYFIAFCNILSFVRYIPRQIFLCSRKILYSFKMPRSHFQYHMSHIFKTKYDKKKKLCLESYNTAVILCSNMPILRSTVLWSLLKQSRGITLPITDRNRYRFERSFERSFLINA